MRSLMNLDSKLVRVMSRMGDVMILNALLLLCSLPILTFGAAVTAVYDMTLRILRDEDEGTFMGFFRAFKGNFASATRLWLVFFAGILICVGDFYAGQLPQLALFEKVLTIVAYAQGGILFALALYAFPLTARYDNTLVRTLVNSLLLVITHLPETLLMMVITASAPLVFLYVPLPGGLFPCFVTLCLLIWFGGALFLNSMVVRRIFQKQFGTEETDRQKEERIERETRKKMQGLM